MLKKFIQEFSDFLKKGNMVEIAVGLLLASTFNNLVTTFSDVFIMPIINRILGFTEGNDSSFTILGMKFEYGLFVSSFISFVIIGFVLFSIIKTYNKFVKSETVKKEEVVTETELSVLKEIKELLKDKEK